MSSFIKKNFGFSGSSVRLEKRSRFERVERRRRRRNVLITKKKNHSRPRPFFDEKKSPSSSTEPRRVGDRRRPGVLSVGQARAAQCPRERGGQGRGAARGGGSGSGRSRRQEGRRRRRQGQGVADARPASQRSLLRLVFQKGRMK